MGKKWIKGDYTQVPNKRFLKGKDPQYRSIFLALCDYANESGVCFPSQETLAKDSGCSLRTVVNRVKKMLEDKLLSVIYKGAKGRSNKYQIHTLNMQEVHVDCAGAALSTMQELHTNYNQGTKTNNYKKNNKKRR